MKGTLHRISDKWVVWYDEEPLGGNITFVNGSLPLHPHDAKQYQEEYDFYGATGFVPTEVDFEIIEGYAQLITMLPEEETAEYPELEGTVNLCNDLVSDREIEKASLKVGYVHKDNIMAFQTGAKWYRDHSFTKENLIELVQTLTSTPSDISREAATHIVENFIKSKQ